MSKPQNIIQVIAESELGIGYAVSCTSHATAQYYLAQLAARHRLPLETIVEDHVFQIGHVNYVLDQRRVLSIEDVNALRKTHEG